MNTPNERFSDDPRLTAYALGELPQDECAKVEAILEKDAAAREMVEEIRATARELEMGLREEGSATLDESRRAAILGAETAPSRRRAPRWVGVLAAAAALCLTATILIWQGGVLRGRRPGAPGEASLARFSKTASVQKTEMDAYLRQNGYLAPGQPPFGPAPSPTAANPAPPGQGFTGGTSIGVGQGGHFGRGNSVARGRVAEGKKAARLEDEVRGLSVAPKSEAVDTLEELEVTRESLDVDSATKGKDDLAALRDDKESNTESYANLVENPFHRVADEHLSTFSIDVDTASYANARRFLASGQMPPASAVRIEEFVNYFTYDYPEPDAGQPFSVAAEVARCPWKPDHKLVLVGLKGRSVTVENRKPTNLVFLIDVSGSMDEPNKLPLLQRSMKLLAEQLDSRDRIAMVVYAGNSGLVLPSTQGNQQGVIVGALDRLSAGGSTNGGAGIELAYKVAQENFLPEGNNRVVLCTDGDFNVGVTDQGSLVKLIEEKRKTGVFLSVLGFGTGNTKDSTMELLADKGNGNYAYIDTLNEARKVLCDQVGGTLEVIAKDVKIQIEFNPATVEAFRLIGYEDRILAHQDFNDDTKDAGEIGAGAAVTALYEIVPKGVAIDLPKVDPSRYAPEKSDAPATAFGGELLFLKLRYKAPTSDQSQLISTPLADGDHEFRSASQNLRFASSVAGFAMLLKGSQNAGDLSLEKVRAFAQESIGDDKGGYRAEFLGLVDRARSIAQMTNELRQIGYHGGSGKK